MSLASLVSESESERRGSESESESEFESESESYLYFIKNLPEDFCFSHIVNVFRPPFLSGDVLVIVMSNLLYHWC